MFIRRMKITTSLILFILLFIALEAGSGYFYLGVSKKYENINSKLFELNRWDELIDQPFYALINARDNLSNAEYDLKASRAKEDTAESKKLYDEYQTLINQARIEFDKADNATQKLKKMPVINAENSQNLAALLIHYKNIRDICDQVLAALETGDVTKIDSFDVIATQQKLNAFSEATERYNRFIAEQCKLPLAESKMLFTHTSLVLALISVINLAVSFIIWFVMRIAWIRPLKKLLGCIKAIGCGDLSNEIAIDDKSRNEINQLAMYLTETQDKLVQLVAQVRDGANVILLDSSEIANGNNDLSSRTEQQSSALQETAASMEQLTATVLQNTEHAHEATELAKTASNFAHKGGDVMHAVEATMTSITASSKKIADIISLIDSIAFQTNILALNAAVEAARAGEQGRGFAVVASEVRNLAQRSAEAAKQIKSLIEESGNRIDTGTTQVALAAATMQEIVQSVTRVTAIMADIYVASEEQSRGISQVSQAVTEMDTVTQQNASLVQESANAAISLEKQAALLNQSISVFKLHKPSLP